MKKTKRILSIFLVMLMIVLSVPMVFATTINAGSCGDNLVWVFDSNGVLAISGVGKMTDYSNGESAAWSAYKDSITAVEINSGVQSIGSYAFFECSNLKTVEIPDTVTSIGDYAFRKCSSLESVSIPNSVVEFGKYIFRECESLKHAKWPSNSNKITYGAFAGCTSLDDFIIPDNVKHISVEAFSRCSSLSSINIPEGVEIIDMSAFADCDSLVSVTIPSTVTQILEGAFWFCDNLSSVTINDAVVCLTGQVFHRCSSLTEVSLGKNVTRVNESDFVGTALVNDKKNYDENGVLYLDNVLLTIGNYDQDSFSVKYGTTLIAQDAMVTENAINIKSITIPDTVKYINDYGIGYYYTYGKVSETPIPDVRIYYHKNTVTKEFWPEAIQVDCNWKSTVIKEATCSERGETQKVCTLCGDTKTEYTSNPNNHDYGNWTDHGDGTHVRVCKRNASHMAFESHNWTNWTTVQNMEQRICNICGAKETRKINENIYNLGEETYKFPNYGDNDSYGGHCFGMSSTSSMYYMGLLNLSLIGGTSNQALYSFNATDIVKKPICHYQAIQGSYSLGATVAGGEYYKSRTYRINSDWNEVINYVKNHNYDNKGSLQIGFRKKDEGGHAINFLRYEVVNGQERIYAYDNNFPTIETYFYKDAQGYILQEPRATFSGAIDCIALRDVSKYYHLAGGYDATHVLYAEAGSISIECANVYPMDGDITTGEYMMYEIPADQKEVQIVPQTDSATFTYLEQEYQFGNIDDDTYGVITLADMDEGGTGSEASFTIYNAPTDPTPDTPAEPQPENLCPWCGQEHTGFFGGIVGFFHRIFATIFGARY